MEDTFKKIETIIKVNKCVLFIKGTLNTPKSKASQKLADILAPYNYHNIRSYNVLEDDKVRQWVKFYSKWPAFPQVYIEGTFIGGIDVVTGLIKDNKFDDIMPEICKH